ncbi:uncharacterized protein BDZ83DRAFT_647453 [Colletotrichum acutatum]|uniref:Uncharacterized protein n=1 Tax=Glomerella acutata TaxID=27357 RepID=A0AAD9D0C7_GLOAC|nr:uncharacterized protein BDZ83DRAFT_647453 [Colletotrichum acutatum]KAK1729893.1 hypothetical protein BDZ83DRAFT_647453 [Colletotrichum acutatum]
MRRGRISEQGPGDVEDDCEGSSSSELRVEGGCELTLIDRTPLARYWMPHHFSMNRGVSRAIPDPKPLGQTTFECSHSKTWSGLAPVTPTPRLELRKDEGQWPICRLSRSLEFDTLVLSKVSAVALVALVTCKFPLSGVLGKRQKPQRRLETQWLV